VSVGYFISVTDRQLTEIILVIVSTLRVKPCAQFVKSNNRILKYLIKIVVHIIIFNSDHVLCRLNQIHIREN